MAPYRRKRCLVTLLSSPLCCHFQSGLESRSLTGHTSPPNGRILGQGREQISGHYLRRKGSAGSNDSACGARASQSGDLAPGAPKRFEQPERMKTSKGFPKIESEFNRFGTGERNRRGFDSRSCTKSGWRPSTFQRARFRRDRCDAR